MPGAAEMLDYLSKVQKSNEGIVRRQNISEKRLIKKMNTVLSL